VAHVDIFNEDRILVQASFLEKDLIKQIPGALWNNQIKEWTLPLSWAACVQARAIFKETLTIGAALARWSVKEYNDRIVPSLALRNRYELTDEERLLFTDDPLYEFQRLGSQWLDAVGSGLLGDDMGAGKTIQMLEFFRLFDERCRTALPAAVICPNGVKQNWADEARRWCKVAVPYVVTGSAAMRKNVFEAAAKDPNALLIINIEAVRMHSRLAPWGSIRLKRCIDCGGNDPKVKTAQCEVHLKELNQIPFKTVVLDEAHRIKDPHSKQTRACWAVGHQPSVQRRFAMTGTVIATDPSDLWALMHFTYPREYPVKSPFVDRYCLLSWGQYGGMEVKGLRPDTRDEFYKIFDARFRRMPKALVLSQLPPKVYIRREVELSTKQLKAYREMEDGLVTRLPDGTVLVAPNNLVGRTRLMQFASATMESDLEGAVRMCDPSSKIDELVSVMEDIGDKPFLVSAEHRQLIYLAAARLDKLKVRYGLITGMQSEFERKLALDEFQNGKLQVLMFTLKAGGTGLTMTAADTAVRLQRSWSMIDNQQGENRNHRIGSEKHDSITYIDIVARETVETAQLQRLYAKSERLEEINRDRVALIAAGLPTTEFDAEEALILNSDLGE
jgi:SNF2 family DNA or RNA helicase